MNLHDEIAKVASELFEKSGCVPGRDLDNWLDAEKIVLTMHASQEIEEPEEGTDIEEAEAGLSGMAEGGWMTAGGEESGETTVVEEMETNGSSGVWTGKTGASGKNGPAKGAKASGRAAKKTPRKKNT